MRLTRLHLNARRQGAQKLLGSPQAMHAAIMSGFPPGVDVGRPLWRIDPDDPLRPTLYVVSRERPDLTHVEEQAGWPTQPTSVTAAYETLLSALTEGQTWAFRLKANPTHRATLRGRQRVLAHVTVAQQMAWLLDRSESLGVSFGTKDEPTFDLVHRDVISFKRQDGRVTLGVATFAGVLKVTDAEALQHALVTGVGRAKAYGCGLMTLAQP